MRDPRPRGIPPTISKRQMVDLHNAGKPKREAMDSTASQRCRGGKVKSINATGSPRWFFPHAGQDVRILGSSARGRRLRMESTS